MVPQFGPIELIICCFPIMGAAVVAGIFFWVRRRKKDQDP